VFVHRKLGTVNRLLKRLSHSAVDDLGQSVEIRKDSLSHVALDFAYRTASSMEPDRYQERLVTHVDGLSLSLHLVTKYILVWATADSNDEASSYSNSRNYLVLCSYAPRAWRPMSAKETVPRRRGEKSNAELATICAGFLSVQNVYKLSELKSMEFTQTAETLMVLTFRGNNVLQIRFRDDSSREMWRKELKRYVYAQQRRWSSSLLPDVNDSSRYSLRYI